MASARGEGEEAQTLEEEMSNHDEASVSMLEGEGIEPPKTAPVPALMGMTAWNTFKSMSAMLVEDAEDDVEEERVDELIQEIGALEDEEEKDMPSLIAQVEGSEEDEELSELMAEFGDPLHKGEMSEFMKRLAENRDQDFEDEQSVQDEFAMTTSLDPAIQLPPKTKQGKTSASSSMEIGNDRPIVSFDEDMESSCKKSTEGMLSTEPPQQQRKLQPPPDVGAKEENEEAESTKAEAARKPTKPLKICMMVVGTYGDVLPFLAVGDVLRKEGHFVRVATHEVFRQKVEDRGMEFFCLGADPLLLSEFMVKHKSLLISNPLKAIPALSDLGPQLKLAKEIIARSWPAACSDKFRADAIIANPPAWGHVHVAEKLNVPLHIMFPQPWLPTKAFPHVFSGWDFGAPPRDRNVFSHHLMDAMMYLPIHFAINRFRSRLGLNPVVLAEGMSGLLRKRPIPFSFIWSEALVPFPSDWPAHRADITGAIHNPPEDYSPDKKLAAFLADGPPPILITFGSMRIQNGPNLAKRILWAARTAKVRVLVQSGWTDLSVGMKKDPLVFHIKAAPHTWLLPLVAAAVHHGGAGTTHAAALAGKPQQVCPFFGDQPFWGFAIHKAGAGLRPVPIDDMSAQRLAAAFTKLVKAKDLQASARSLASKLSKEDGARQAVDSFWRHYKSFQPALRSRRSSVVQQRRMPSSAEPLNKLRRGNSNLKAGSTTGSFGPFGERVDILRPSARQLPQFRAPDSPERSLARSRSPVRQSILKPGSPGRSLARGFRLSAEIGKDCGETANFKLKVDKSAGPEQITAPARELVVPVDAPRSRRTRTTSAEATGGTTEAASTGLTSRPGREGSPRRKKRKEARRKQDSLVGGPGGREPRGKSGLEKVVLEGRRAPRRREYVTLPDIRNGNGR